MVEKQHERLHISSFTHITYSSGSITVMSTNVGSTPSADIDNPGVLFITFLITCTLSPSILSSFFSVSSAICVCLSVSGCVHMT